MENLLRRLYCFLTGECRSRYTKSSDQLAMRYANMEQRTDELIHYWRPRDLLDIK